MSSSGGLVQGHTCCPARVARCFRGRTCPYRFRDACWFSHDDDPEEDPPCRVDAATASLGLAGRVRRLERIVEQIGGVLVPQIWEPIGEVVQLSPRERVQNRTPEQVMDSSVPPIMEDNLPFVPQERVQNRTPDQIVGIPVPQISEDSLPFVPQERVQNRTPELIVDFPVEAIVEVVPSPPQECVQNRTPEQILDVPVP